MSKPITEDDVNRKLSTVLAILGNLPEMPGYSGSVLMIDDVEVAGLIGDILNVQQLLAAYTAQLSVQPDIDAMCMTWRHDFGLDKCADSPISSGMNESEREALRRDMRQLVAHHWRLPQPPESQP